MQAILNFDLGIFRFVEEYLMNPFTDKLFTFITHLGDGGWLWIGIALVMLLFPKTRRCGIAVAVALLCSEFIGNQFLKHLIARPRPFLLEEWQGIFVYPGLIPMPSSYSFPSGHTASSVGSAMALLLCRKDKYGWAAVVLALLIGYSRIHVHVHYPTDVLAAILCGALYALIGWFIAKKLPHGRWEEWGPGRKA
ncbi:MAG: phosphatase PAP2 family protein [Oscillospiraceae bacterium]|nr:phosphatase PAP2 family protein [Oscillospiraceae bacterium]